MIPPTKAKDSMKSSWHTDKEQWRLQHYIMNPLDAYYHTRQYQPVPIFDKSAPMPYLSDWSCHVFILVHAAWPVLLQYLYKLVTGNPMNGVLTFILYTLAFRLNGLHLLRVMSKVGSRVGFLDGDKHARDDVPDVGVGKALLSVLLTTSARSLFTVCLTYDSSQAPSLSWWLPVELGLYSVILDFWFYVYHRACHEVDFLWKYHRTHHLTKHPNPLLAGYSDTEQEIIEIALVPLATYCCLKMMGFPMGFYDWWVCHQYLIFTEAAGHSGLRLYSNPPGTSNWFLRLFGCELVIEDHDLHHRNGWRRSKNYGKQTRLWDKLFGTAGVRIETTAKTVDFGTAIHVPLI